MLYFCVINFIGLKIKKAAREIALAAKSNFISIYLGINFFRYKYFENIHHTNHQ